MWTIKCADVRRGRAQARSKPDIRDARFVALIYRWKVHVIGTPTDSDRCLSVVVPCYNERDTVELVVERVLRSRYTAEVIVVDDGSTDGTRAVVRTFDDPRVKVILQTENRGKGAALRRGFAEATADFVIVQDADHEYDPADYEFVLAPLLDGKADVCYGSRFQTDRPHRVLYFWHTVGNRVLTLASNALTNLNLSDMETCYKAFRREVIQGIDIEEDRFGFEPEITAKIAAQGWRIYEVGISYTGRTYDEGKKIGWRDGVRAMYCVFRYSPQLARVGLREKTHAPSSFEQADDELLDTLAVLDEGHNYSSWLAELFREHQAGEILEVGAGHGTLTEHLAAFGSVTAVEPSDRAAAHLRSRFAGDPRVTVQLGDHTSVRPESADTIVLSNVLEHIEDDVDALRSLRTALRPGGRIIVFSPAFDLLYSEFDRKVGHYRRYRARTLRARMRAAGLDVVECRYVNSLGFATWLLYARVLGRTPTKSVPARLYDSVAVPMLRRLERGRRPPLGQSVLCVGERSADAVVGGSGALRRDVDVVFGEAVR
jgi:glycosyltransferase involved in cell wall biosynthesis